MQISKHFTSQELMCPCCETLHVDSQFLKALEEVREAVGRPFIINSAYRCEHHNLGIGGRLSSRHLLGMAVDISTRGWASDDLHYLLFELTSYHTDDHSLNTGIGIYRSWIHFDLRPDQESLWIDL